MSDRVALTVTTGWTAGRPEASPSGSHPRQPVTSNLECPLAAARLSMDLRRVTGIAGLAK
ncbi:hypothetical protein [Paludibaculum fermentans]|uniref:hypothetical protein n=1 Tax=Paludibaculum fermentans TaxID=1473598 RepID=UPI003EBC65D0